MDKFPNPESQEKKAFLYHMVPEDMRGDVLHPLNKLKDAHPDIYVKEVAKYKGREELMKKEIAMLECIWNDVMHLVAVNPQELKKALLAAGMEPKEMRFYQIDPEMLNPEKTTIYLYQEGKDSFLAYDPKNLAERASLPEETKAYFKETIQKGEKPLLFIGVPHILHKGSIDISKLPVITA